MRTNVKLMILFFSLFSFIASSQDYKTLISDGKLKKGRFLLSKTLKTIPKGAKVEVIYKSFDKGYYGVVHENVTGFLHQRHFSIANTTTKKYQQIPGKVVFREDFNNNKNNWRETSNPNKEFSFRNGEYFIMQRDVSRLTWESKNVDLNSNSDFVIEASIRLHWRDSGGAHLMYGVDDNNRSYHSVKIKKEKDKKEVYIGTYSNGKWEGEWTDAKINDFGKENLVQIVKVGSVLNFYINGEFTYTKPFKRFFGSAVALGCEGPQSASFDYLLVKQGPANITKAKKATKPQETIKKMPSPQSVRLEKNGGVLEIPITLNNVIRINSIFEEGASNITVSADVALMLVNSGTIKNRDWLNGQEFEFSDGSIAKSERFKLESLKIGTGTIENVICTISGFMKVPMIVGANVLNQFGTYSFDSSNQTLIFK